jgi:hypothetical protein
MIRCSQRVVGITFADNCPPNVRHRVLAGNNPAHPTFSKPRIWPGDSQWVTVIDKCIPGWKVPFLGFVPDSIFPPQFGLLTASIRRILRRVRRR